MSNRLPPPWTGWDTSHSILEGSYLSIVTALICVSTVVLLSTLNLLTTLYVAATVAGVLMLVVGTCVGMGWELGFLEGICFAILIGLSCDFVLHMAHAYQASPEFTRQDKSRDALTRMGPPIFAAALSTAATGAVMYACTILFFNRFGTILLLTMVYSILTSIFFYLALTNAAGPQKHTCSIAPSSCATAWVDGIFTRKPRRDAAIRTLPCASSMSMTSIGAAATTSARSSKAELRASKTEQTEPLRKSFELPTLTSVDPEDPKAPGAARFV